MPLSSALPQTASLVLRVTVVFTSIVFSAYGLYFAWFHAFGPFAIAIASLLVVIAVFLWRLNRYARSAAKFVIGFFIVLYLGGTFNPFYALDYAAAHGHQPPWGTMLLCFVPLAMLGLFVYGILDRFKSEFR